jgi:hypothetical protein
MPGRQHTPPGRGGHQEKQENTDCVNPAQYVGAPVIGALAGLYPAARAARMPTEALRTM